jgi:hypothetical protein
MMMNQKWRWVGGVCLDSQGCQVCQSAKGVSPKPVTNYLYMVKTNRTIGSAAGWPDTALCLVGWVRSPDSCHASLVWTRATQSQRSETITRVVKWWSDSTLEWLDSGTPSVRSSPERFQSHFLLTRCIRSEATWRALASGPLSSSLRAPAKPTTSALTGLSHYTSGRIVNPL